MINRLGHYSVRAKNLDVSTAFYSDVLGLRQGPRPSFDFPGVWLYLEDGHEQGDQGCVHLIGAGDGAARDAYLGARADHLTTGALDHIAFVAADWPAFRERLRTHKVAFTERHVPHLSVRQVFLTDPDGVTIELNYPDGAGMADVFKPETLATSDR